MKKIVMKFGGTSVATGENILNAASLVADCAKKEYEVIVVVSALDGVTDKLFEAAERSQKENQSYIQKFKQEMLEKHSTVAAKAIKHTNIQKEVLQVIRKTIDELDGFRSHGRVFF